MNKQDQIKALTQIKNMAAECKFVAEQNIAIATRLETEAITALELLGAKPGRAQQGQVALSDEEILKIKASLTTVRKNKAG